MNPVRSIVVLLGLVACSAPRQSSVSDAATSRDAARDASRDSTPGGVVTVTVTSRTDFDRVVPGAPVVFVDTDQSVTYVHADSLGVAQATVHAGASVTVIYDQNTVEYQTVLDVQPGDQLVFGHGTSVDVPPITVTFTAYPGAGVTYTLQSACGTSTVSPGTTTVTPFACFAPVTNTDAYVAAYVNNKVVATAAVHGVDLQQPIVIPNVWTAATSLNLSYTGAPGRITAMFQDAPEYFSTQTDLQTSYMGTLNVPVDGTKQYVRTDFEIGSVYESIWETLTPGTSSYHLDVASHVLPEVHVTYDPTSRTIAPTGTATLPNSLLLYSVDWGVPGSPQAWEVFTHTLGPVVLPELPADIPDYSAQAHSPSLLIVTTPSLPTWDQVRQSMAVLLDSPRAPLFDYVQSELVH